MKALKTSLTRWSNNKQSNNNNHKVQTFFILSQFRKLTVIFHKKLKTAEMG